MLPEQTAMGALVPPQSLTLTEPVWGIDPSTLRVSVGLVGGGPVRWATCSLPKHHGNLAVWFTGAHSALVPFFRSLVAEHGLPVLVLVEEPFGGGGKGKLRTVHPSSNRMLGVILAAVGAAVGLGAEVDLIQPNSWKSAGLGAGHGHATPVQYTEWAQSVAGYTGDLQDEAAAIGIATAAGVRVSLRRAA